MRQRARSTMSNRSAWVDAYDLTVPVWDCFVRVFHWSLAALVLTEYLTTDDARTLHHLAGYAVLGLIGVRLVWGVIGSRHARFVSFVAGPRTVLAYLRALRQGTAPRHLGHNPAGGMMIVALLGLLIVVAGSGWLSETDVFYGVPWVDHLHHISAHLLLVLIGLHVCGVIVSSWLHRENLVLAMLTGRKSAAPGATASSGDAYVARQTSRPTPHAIHPRSGADRP
jgi:cytochrome b